MQGQNRTESSVSFAIESRLEVLEGKGQFSRPILSFPAARLLVTCRPKGHATVAYRPQGDRAQRPEGAAREAIEGVIINGESGSLNQTLGLRTFMVI